MNLLHELQFFLNRFKVLAWIVYILATAFLLQIALWLIFALLGAGQYLDLVRNMLSLPAGSLAIWKQIWSIFSWPFVYPLGVNSLLNALFDGLIFWGFGRIVQQMIGEERTSRFIWLSIPILGILIWLAGFILGAQFYAGLRPLMLAVIFAAVTLTPRYPVMVYVFQVPIWVVGAVTLLFSLMNSKTGIAASLLGAGLGVAYIYTMRQGWDAGEWLQNKWQNLTSKPKTSQAPFMRVSYKKENLDPSQISQEEIDKILDKIVEKGGYKNLSKEEQEILAKAAGRRKEDTQ